MAVVHKGSISMGMVLIPVGLYKTTVDNDIHFNQLEKESKARIKYKKYCSHCGKEVKAEDIIKGYEYEKDKYVVMTQEELEKIKTKKDKTIHILQFAKMAEVNMIYYEQDYYAIPETGAEKAFELLRQSLLLEKKVLLPKLSWEPPGAGNRDGRSGCTGQCDRSDGSPSEVTGTDKGRTGRQKKGRKCMMDLFQAKNIQPMLIAQIKKPFDDPDWIYELKLDGCRCIAYLEGGSVVLRNKRNMELFPRFPELRKISGQVRQKCVLDGG